MKNYINIIIVILLVAISTTTAMAYPSIISWEKTNHTLNKQLIYSIPEKYFKFVDTVEFRSNYTYAYCKTYDEFGQKQCWKGWSQVSWDKNHNCFNGKIILNNPSLLIHELGHIHEHCELKRDISTEEFANNFRIK